MVAGTASERMVVLVPASSGMGKVEEGLDSLLAHRPVAGEELVGSATPRRQRRPRLWITQESSERFEIAHLEAPALVAEDLAVSRNVAPGNRHAHRQCLQRRDRQSLRLAREQHEAGTGEIAAEIHTFFFERDPVLDPRLAGTLLEVGKLVFAAAFGVPEKADRPSHRCRLRNLDDVGEALAGVVSAGHQDVPTLPAGAASLAQWVGIDDVGHPHDAHPSEAVLAGEFKLLGLPDHDVEGGAEAQKPLGDPVRQTAEPAWVDRD